MMDSDEPPSIDALLTRARDTVYADRAAAAMMPSSFANVTGGQAACCCGRPQCAFLAHNARALEGLEQDLVSAAQIGQALLIRHESHMAESEAERLRMGATVESLEKSKRELESANARTIEENRQLLDQLEELNSHVSDADAQIQALTAALQATQAELQRVTVLTQRASGLEAQLDALEAEHAALQTTMNTKEEGERSAVQRWRLAEVTIGQLQAQIDRIEREAQEERARHLEVMGRMERTYVVEKELQSTAGRLKGAAAANHLGKQTDGVVSHFVRDILQDNANLQSGVVELRELLLGSNAEVESLREQLRIHRPMDEGDGALATLSTELPDDEAWTEPKTPEQAANASLHVHHHYHAPNITVRKPKKKRPSVNLSQSGASGASTPRASRIRDWRANTPSSFATILSQTSASVPNHQHHWSTHSANTLSSFASSGPSSPGHTGSIFDTLEGAHGTSPSITPASSVPGSPSLLPIVVTPRKSVARSSSGPLTVQLKSPPSLGTLGTLGTSTRDEFSNTAEALMSPFGAETILEESEYHDDTAIPSFLTELAAPPRLRRAASHESLLSVSGMDIHTLRDRPSQLLLSGPFSPRRAQIHALQSPQAAMSHETATARPGVPGGASAHARSLLSSVQTGAESRSSLGQKVGGWVWSRWGVAPASESPRMRTDRLQVPPRRSFGINQKGQIPWLPPPPATPIQVEVERMDKALLQESLGDALVGLGD